MKMGRDYFSRNSLFSSPVLAEEDKPSHCSLCVFGTGQRGPCVPHPVNLLFGLNRLSQLTLILFSHKADSCGSETMGTDLVFKIALKLWLSQES